MLGLRLVVCNVVLSLRPGGSDALILGLNEVRRKINGGALRNTYIQSAFGVLPMELMACQCRSKFRHWLPLVPMVCQCLPMATIGFYHWQPIL